MNRYKKELQLRGYSNIPTVKILETKKGKRLSFFDNWDIKNIKQALQINGNGYHRRFAVIDFVTKYQKDNKTIYESKWDRRGCFNSSKELLKFIKELQKLNTNPEANFYSPNPKDDFIKVNQVTEYKVKFLV